jgi:hypothetical protein
METTLYEQGKEIASLQKAVELQGETLGKSIDLIRNDLRDLRSDITKMATKDDLVAISPNRDCRAEVCGRLSRIELDLYGKDTTGKESGRKAFIAQICENTRFIDAIRAYWVVIVTGAIVLGFFIAYVFPQVIKFFRGS